MACDGRDDSVKQLHWLVVRTSIQTTFIQSDTMQVYFNSTGYRYRYAKLFQYFYRASCIILHRDQQMHNYLKNYHTPTCSDTIVLSSGSF